MRYSWKAVLGGWIREKEPLKHWEGSVQRGRRKLGLKENYQSRRRKVWRERGSVIHKPRFYSECQWFREVEDEKGLKWSWFWRETLSRKNLFMYHERVDDQKAFFNFFTVVKYKWHKIYHLTHFEVCSLVALSTFILCSHHHHPETCLSRENVKCCLNIFWFD